MRQVFKTRQKLGKLRYNGKEERPYLTLKACLVDGVVVANRIAVEFADLCRP